MRILFIFFLFCGCSLSRVSYQNNKPVKKEISHTSSFEMADANNDMVIDQNESINYFSYLQKEEVYSPAYSFLFIIGLVFLFVFFSIFLSRKKD